MGKGRDLNTDLDRLLAATTMFATQQWERTVLGEEQDYEDAKRETHQVVSDVLKTIEKSLDEDLLERLDRGDYPRLSGSWGGWPRPLDWTRYWDWRTCWPYHTKGVFSARPKPRRRHEEMLDQILDDFRAEFEARLKRARREERALSEPEVEELLADLRQDLYVVARRSRRREDQREADEAVRHD